LAYGKKCKAKINKLEVKITYIDYGFVKMSGDINLLFTTVDSKEKAQKLAREIVEKKLAACVSISEVNSTYYWEKKVVEEREYLLIIKTSKEKLEKLINWLKENHPYQVPELIAIEAEAFEPYLKWLKEYLTM